jgi:hypothetical protein
MNETAFASLNKDHCGDFVILCRCLQLGFGNPAQFGMVVELGLKSVGRWPLQIQREARNTLAKVPLSAPQAITVAILDNITQALSQPAQGAEPSLFIVAQLLSSHYLGTQELLHFPLLLALLNMLSAAEGKKTLPLDIQSIMVAICSNPVRFLDVLILIGDKRGLLFSILKPTEMWENSLICSLTAPARFVLASDGPTRAAVKAIKQKGLTVEELSGGDSVGRFQIELPLLLSLFPAELRRLLEHTLEAGDEDLLGVVIEIYLIVALQGRNVPECTELLNLLPESPWNCEYSQQLGVLRGCLAVTNTNFELLNARIDKSLSQFLVVTSPSNTAAALLFEHVVWAEADDVLIIFKRLRLKPALWFAAAVASLFSSIVANPSESFVDLLRERVGNSAQNLVWVGFVLFKRCVADLRSILVTEEFWRLPKALFYPLITYARAPSDESLITTLQTKYGTIMQSLFKVMVPTKTRE